eukprot:scaffold66474_cov48-Phaeocystis_antarctica.AAC.3
MTTTGGEACATPGGGAAVPGAMVAVACGVGAPENVNSAPTSRPSGTVTEISPRGVEICIVEPGACPAGSVTHIVSRPPESSSHCAAACSSPRQSLRIRPHTAGSAFVKAASWEICSGVGSAKLRRTGRACGIPPPKLL